MTEVRATRLAGWAGVVGILLLTLSFMVANWTDPADPDSVVRADIRGADGQAYAAFTMLTPAVALLLWFATGLRRYLLVRCRADRLAGAVVPGMAVFAGLTAAGIGLILAVPLANAWYDRFRIDVNTFRTLTTSGIFVVFVGAVGAAVVVAAMSRAAEVAELIPPQLAWLGYAVAFVGVFTLWTFGFMLLVLDLWLLGAAIALVRGAASMTAPGAAVPAPGPAAEAPAAEAPAPAAGLPTQSAAPAAETRKEQPAP